MATKFDEVYGYFLSQIDDYDLANLDKETLDDVLKRYLINSLLHLQDSITDLLDLNIEENQFNTTLTFTEILLTAKAMKLTWTSEKRYAEELMRKAIGDRDYKAVQGTEYLREIGLVERQLREEIRQDLMRHSYSKQEFWGDILG